MSSTATHSSGRVDRRSRGSQARRVGWSVLLTGAASAVALYLAHTVLWRVACNGSQSGWGANRASFCIGDGGALLIAIVQTSVVALVITAASAGLVCGVIAVTTPAGGALRTRSLWLLVSAALYAGTIAIHVAHPAFPDLPLANEMPSIALKSAAVLFIWLAVTGSMLFVARFVSHTRLSATIDRPLQRHRP